MIVNVVDGDYSRTSQEVLIPASSGSSRTCTNIAITDDTIVENDEDFRVSFQIPSGNNANTGVIASTRVVIIDDDSKQYFSDLVCDY